MTTLDLPASRGENFGVRINLHPLHSKRDTTATGCPVWANRTQHEVWRCQGVVMWQKETQRLIVISGGEALTYLAALRDSDAWQQDGLSITHSCVRIVLPGRSRKLPSQKPGTQPAIASSESKHEWVTAEVMRLTPDQTGELLAVLEHNEADLRRMAEAEEKARSDAFLKVYRLLLDTSRLPR